MKVSSFSKKLNVLTFHNPVTGSVSMQLSIIDRLLVHVQRELDPNLCPAFFQKNNLAEF